MPYDREGNYELKLITLTDDTTVAHAPTSITNTLQPDVGFIYQIIEIGYTAPDPIGSGAGTHKIVGEYNGAYKPIFSITGTTGTAISINLSGFTGDSDETPTNIREQQILKNGGLIFASNSVPFNFTYTNSTDVDQTGTRTCIVFVKKYREAIF